MNGELLLHSFCNCVKCSNLSLAQRMHVIRDYDASRSKKPSIKSLASKYDCCYSEIKKILLNRDSINFTYKTQGEPQEKQQQPQLPKKPPLSRESQEIAFLGKVMYEYLQRVVYSNYAIDEEKVLLKALEFKHHLRLGLDPGKKWLDHFKLRYTIWAFDLKSLRRCIQLREIKRPHLSAADIVEHVRKREQLQAAARAADVSRNNGNSPHEGNYNHQQQKYHSNSRPENNEHILPDDVYPPSEQETHQVIDHNNHPKQNEPKNPYNTRRVQQSNQQHNHNDNYYQQHPNNTGDDRLSPMEPTVVYESIDDDDEDQDGVNNVHSKSHSNNIHAEETNVSANHDTSKRKLNLNSIESPQEALEHLKLLEEYAMLQDNFRAIGLLTQLEQCFQKQTKN